MIIFSRFITAVFCILNTVNFNVNYNCMETVTNQSKAIQLT